MPLLRPLISLFVSASLMFLSSALAQENPYSNPYANPYSSTPLYSYGSPDSSGSGGRDGLSHSPSRDLYGNKKWGRPVVSGLKSRKLRPAEELGEPLVEGSVM
jgi:hypothetical protein